MQLAENIVVHKVEHQSIKSRKNPLMSHQLGLLVFGESRETCSYLKYRKGDPLSPLNSSCGGMGRRGSI